MSKIKTPLLLIATALITFLLTFTCNRPSSKTAIIKTKIQRIDSGYKKTTIIYKRQNDSLNNLLDVINSKLVLSKNSLHNTQNKLFMVLKSGSGDKASTNCDSIKVTTITYITQVDSILNDYAVKDSVQTGLITIKDKQISMCDSSYNVMAELSKELIDSLHKSERRNKRNKTLAKVFGAALFVAGAIIGASNLK